MMYNKWKKGYHVEFQWVRLHGVGRIESLKVIRNDYWTIFYSIKKGNWVFDRKSIKELYLLKDYLML
ncbi:MAG: hypothetical protein ACFFKA_00020 [Candidatus Thorarchaeota archaeon]